MGDGGRRQSRDGSLRRAARWFAERWLTVRMRTTLAAVVVVGVALAAGGVALVVVMRDVLVDEVRSAARLRAAEVVAALEAGEAPVLAVGAEDEQLIQVVDRQGRMVAASENVAGLPPVASLEPGASARITPPLDDDAFVAVAAGTGEGAKASTVIVAQSVEDALESTQVVSQLLVIGLPLLLGVVGVTSWVVVGRALSPVEAIRSEVDEISASALDRRVPGPAGRDEIARLADTMNEMLDRLERAQARQRRFISDASHELRSPIASIRQHAEVALAHPGTTSVTDLASTVRAENLRVQRLVDDLLLLATVDEDALRINRRPLDLDDLVLDEARRLRETSGVRIGTGGVSAARIEGDPGRLRRVLRNVGDNAARHARTRVAFALAERNGDVVLKVDDDGPGIAESDRARVVERFVRLDAARSRDAGGAGLGLAIVAELVAAHGGSLSIGDSPLGGARIEIRFSAHRDWER